MSTNIVGLGSNSYDVHLHNCPRVQTFRRTMSWSKAQLSAPENHDGGLNKNLLYEILRSELFLVFLCPLSTFSFYFLLRPGTDLDGKLLTYVQAYHSEHVAACTYCRPRYVLLHSVIWAVIHTFLQESRGSSLYASKTFTINLSTFVVYFVY